MEIHRQCVDFHASVTSPMNELCMRTKYPLGAQASPLAQLADRSDAANTPDHVGPLLETLAKEMDVICNRAIPQGSPEGKQARHSAGRDQLPKLKAEIKIVGDRCDAVVDAVNKVWFSLVPC